MVPHFANVDPLKGPAGMTRARIIFEDFGIVMHHW